MAFEDYIKQAPPDTRIWRYMNWEKFISLLDYRALFFCLLNNLEDPFEGSLSLANFPRIKDTTLEQSFIEMYHAPNGLRAYNAVSCWSINNYQSNLLWDNYVRDGEGIAIRTTVSKLLESINYDREVRNGIVQYKQLPDPPPGQGYAIPSIIPFYKKPEYKDEREYRLAIYAPLRNDVKLLGGMMISVDLKTLFGDIYISPTQSNWKVNLVQEVIQAKIGLEINVVKSLLNTSPDY